MTATLHSIGHVSPSRAARSRPPTSAKTRRARAAVNAAAMAVEEVLGLRAIALVGDERLPGRTIAMHVAREAFRIPIYEIARAAGVDRRTASSATFRLWERRDADPVLEAQIDVIIRLLRLTATNSDFRRAVRGAMGHSDNTH